MIRLDKLISKAFAAIDKSYIGIVDEWLISNHLLRLIKDHDCTTEDQLIQLYYYKQINGIEFTFNGVKIKCSVSDSKTPGKKSKVVFLPG